ncbi:hypothetical protein [Streptomyces sp. CC228A]|uniref:hypothetical protein n=1 Tax=Streptomyces sp. CC228A TaxID=2898186 RepID=UPI001F2E3978|nr:hypothetical protein [Streptomyces sp. CC228A]
MTDPDADTVELPPVPHFGRGRPRRATHRIHPRRVAVGHLKLYARLRGWVLAENRAGRAAGLALGALLAARAANQEPRLALAAAGAYAFAAWRAGRPRPLSEEELRRRFLTGVRHLIGDRPGIHLRELYDAFQARPAAAHLDDARLRALLNHCNVPIHKSLRIGDVTGRSGIKAADIDNLLSPTLVDPPSEGVDAGQATPEQPVDRP